MNQPGKILKNIPADSTYYMKKAFQLAEKARGTCSPNPFVGAVIVKNGKVISEGWTQKYGGDHAEIQALKKAGKSARDADLYVTLEPCVHYGKTPPCTDAIIKAGIKRVFIGIIDPNPLVNGKGVKKLMDAGIEVISGIMEEAISRQLEYYLCRIQKGRPFVLWKTALSMDGKYAAKDGSSRWITGESSRRLVHHLREEADVILSSIGTVLKDDPMLNVRLPKPIKQPLRAILDPYLEIPLNSKIVQSLLEYRTTIFCARGKENSPHSELLISLGASIYPITAKGKILCLKEVLGILHQQGNYLILLECGSELASSFFSEKLIDKSYIFYAPKILGGNKAILSELDLPDLKSAINCKDISIQKKGEDWLIIGYPSYS
jgi:diaminohydroxyphosphoribosylaminopyrimidine deaminase/5-amino-6-(5-phosphoribosylamino)uracil reductase